MKCRFVNCFKTDYDVNFDALLHLDTIFAQSPNGRIRMLLLRNLFLGKSNILYFCSVIFPFSPVR
jgi:hypothetical protein